jgi:hypothetical protein
MSVINFPQPSALLSDDAHGKLVEELDGLSKLLLSRLESIDGFTTANEPLEYTCGDFYVLAKMLLLMRMELNDNFEFIMQHVAGKQ